MSYRPPIITPAEEARLEAEGWYRSSLGRWRRKDERRTVIEPPADDGPKRGRSPVHGIGLWILDRLCPARRTPHTSLDELLAHLEAHP